MRKKGKGTGNSTAEIGRRNAVINRFAIE